ncbi:hypothetical protein J1614_003822 [Plenodomus biglobosus]|nr:hypothetical protein J1614_003822 [Plenodomus biglobosus]
MGLYHHHNTDASQASHVVSWASSCLAFTLACEESELSLLLSLAELSEHLCGFGGIGGGDELPNKIIYVSAQILKSAGMEFRA